MSDTPILQVNRDNPGITILTLNRPEKRNALNVELLTNITQALAETEKLTEQRVIIINSVGNVFCTGMDLAEASKPETMEASAELIAKMLINLSTTPLVTIAAVHGAAIAGGAGLMAACDYVLVAEGTKIGFPEVHRGLVAAQVGAVLCRQLRGRDVRELLIFGELIETDRALEMGLINRVVPADKLMSEALLQAEHVQEGAPRAIGETKHLLDSLAPETITEDLKIALRFHRIARQSSEAQEGIEAFLQKRKPSWSKTKGE